MNQHYVDSFILWELITHAKTYIWGQFQNDYRYYRYYR